MRPSEAKRSIEFLTQIKRPAFIWGPPGVGKSDIVKQVAEGQNIQLKDVRLSLLDSVDLKGFPTITKDKKQMTWLPADFLPTDPDGKGILFLDEMNSAPPSVQAAAYQLILNRCIGDYVLPAGWSIIAAGNRETDRSVVNRMPSALANRLVHIDFDINLDDWCTWALENKISTNIIAFLRFKPGLLHAFDPNQRAFPTPRSWTFAAQILESKLSEETEHELLKGTVGEGPAAEVAAFIKHIRDLPTVDEILLNPKKTKVPESPGTLYALVTALGMRAENNNFDRLMEYVGRMQKEFQAVFVRDALRKDNTIAQTSAFTKWGVDNIEVMI